MRVPMMALLGMPWIGFGLVSSLRTAEFLAGSQSLRGF